MIMEEKDTNAKSGLEGNFEVKITNLMLHDRLHTLAAEYSVSAELLVNIAIERLLEDVDFVRNLRIGRIKRE